MGRVLAFSWASALTERRYKEAPALTERRYKEASALTERRYREDSVLTERRYKEASALMERRYKLGFRALRAWGFGRLSEWPGGCLGRRSTYFIHRAASCVRLP